MFPKKGIERQLFTLPVFSHNFSTSPAKRIHSTSFRMEKNDVNDETAFQQVFKSKYKLINVQYIYIFIYISQ